MSLNAISNFTSIIAVIIAIIALLFEIRRNRKDRELSIFLKLIDYYEDVSNKRRNKWKKIKKVVKQNMETSHEIQDKTNGLDYLMKRIDQDENLYAIEHEYLKNEILSINLLNLLSKYANENENMEIILFSKYPDEISFYKNKEKNILNVLESEQEYRLFPKPRFDQILKTDTDKYHDTIEDN